jgi:hypothetical protein
MLFVRLHHRSTRLIAFIVYTIDSRQNSRLYSAEDRKTASISPPPVTITSYM